MFKNPFFLYRKYRTLKGIAYGPYPALLKDSSLTSILSFYK